MSVELATTFLTEVYETFGARACRDEDYRKDLENLIKKYLQNPPSIDSLYISLRVSQLVEITIFEEAIHNCFFEGVNGALGENSVIQNLNSALERYWNDELDQSWDFSSSGEYYAPKGSMSGHQGDPFYSMRSRFSENWLFLFPTNSLEVSENALHWCRPYFTPELKKNVSTKVLLFDEIRKAACRLASDYIEKKVRFCFQVPYLWEFLYGIAQALPSVEMSRSLQLETVGANPGQAICIARKYSLTELNLSKFGDLVSDTYVDQLSKLPKVKSVTIWSRTISNHSIPKFSDQIEELNLRGCIELTVEGLANLSANLSRLSLRGCFRLTDQSISMLSRRLTVLNLSWCHQLTDACIVALPDQLEDLDISACVKITGATFGLLPSRLRRLLCGCPEIIDSGIDKLHLPYLEYLDLSGCIELANPDLLGLPLSLTVLDVRGCSFALRKKARSLLDLRGRDRFKVIPARAAVKRVRKTLERS